MAKGFRGSSRRKTIGPYELIAALHQSFLGPSWLARPAEGKDADLLLARRIAAGEEERAEDVATLAAAAEWACGLEHDGLAKVVGHASDEEELVIASQYVEAEPLRSVLRLAGITRSPMPAPVALRIASDLLEALGYLHEQRFRDRLLLAALNPDAVLLGTDGRVRVLDAVVGAVAAQRGDWAHDPKRAAYDAPEISCGEGEADPRADLFTLGVIMWEMLRNRPLFAGASFDAVSKRVQTASVRRVDSLKPAGGEHIAASVADIVERALQRDPAERYQAITDMQADIVGEDLASVQQVAAFVEKIAADVLGKQRRKVDEAGGAAAPQPGELLELSQDPEAEPSGKPPPKKKSVPKRTLLGMTAPLPPGKGIPAAADSMEAIVLPSMKETEGAGGSGAGGAPDATEETMGGDEDETVALDAVGGEQGEALPLDAVAAVGDAHGGTLPLDAVAAVEDEPGGTLPLDAVAAMEDEPGQQPPADEAAEAAGEEPTAPGLGDRTSDEVAAGLAASIAQSLDDAAGGGEVAIGEEPGALGYDMLSIADDPSVEDDLPAAAKAALDAERAAARRKRLLLIVGGIMVLGVAVIVAAGIVGSSTTPDDPAPGASAAPAGTAASAAVQASAAGVQSAATTAAASASAEAAGGGGAEPAETASAEPSAKPSAAPVAHTPRGRPRPRPRPHPAPKPKPKQKYVPGGI